MGKHDTHHGLQGDVTLELVDGRPIGEAMCRRTIKRRARHPDGELHCERCGRVTVDGGGSLHHRLKRSHLPREKRWEVSNCVWTCGDGVRWCHGWIERNSILAREEGFHVWSWEDWLQVPIKLWHTEGMVLLDDAGLWVPVPPEGGAEMDEELLF